MVLKHELPLRLWHTSGVVGRNFADEHGQPPLAPATDFRYDS